MGGDTVKHMWEQVKWATVELAREMYGSVRVGRKEPKECVVEWQGKSFSKEKVGCLEGGVGSW